MVTNHEKEFRANKGAFSWDTQTNGSALLDAPQQGNKEIDTLFLQMKYTQHQRIKRSVIAAYEIASEILPSIKQLKHSKVELARVVRASGFVKDNIIPKHLTLNRILKENPITVENNVGEIPTPKDKVKLSAPGHSKLVSKDEKTFSENLLKHETKRSASHQTKNSEKEECGHIKHLTKRNAAYSKIKEATLKEPHEHEIQITRRSDSSQAVKESSEVPVMKKAEEAVKNLAARVFNVRHIRAVAPEGNSANHLNNKLRRALAGQCQHSIHSAKDTKSIPVN